MAASSRPSLKVRKQDEGDCTNNAADEKAQAALERIVSIQNEIDRLNEQASEEILKVEQKYNQLRKPHYKNRAKLCDEVPEFWLTTLLNHPGMADMFNDDDEQVMQFLERLSVEEFESAKSGFKISFYFNPNPFFENNTLCKEYLVDSEGEMNVTGTDIIWKEGKLCPGLNFVQNLTGLGKEDISEEKGRKRSYDEPPSFFCWFNDYSETDEIAEFIKDEVWSNPLQFFLQGEISIDEENEEIDEDDEDDELVDLDEEEDD